MISVQEVLAQRPPAGSGIRTYVPPDQVVSFRADTRMDQFIEFMNPIFQRVTQKQVIDPEARTEPIGIAITSSHFFDALEVVLNTKGLTYRENDRYYIIENAPAIPLVMDANQASGRDPGAGVIAVPATSATREVQINAILFDADLTKSLELGVDWSVWFGPQAGGGGAGGAGGAGGGAGGGAAGGAGQIPQIALNTKEFFSQFEDFIVGPDQISLNALTQLLRVFETEGLGRTIANPSVTVQSGQVGNIQIGSDVPVQQRDFAGNTVTQFFQTGIIIDVTPTVIREQLADTLGGQVLEFIHLDVNVENSSGRPTAAGVVIDRNRADTQVLLLDGEQTIIGGLYSTEKSVSRRGIPILKDLPPWFFGLRYLFGYNRHDEIQRELLIILQARMLDPLTVRNNRPFDDQVLERRRRQIEEDIRRMDAESAREIKYPHQN
ncbi:MAG: type II and III secretion system protein [Bacteroidota bacterium]